MPTDGTDVKVYTVGPEYAHAEARKSPALDGVVERDKEGKEIRFPVILNNIEKLIARRVCMAFKVICIEEGSVAANLLWRIVSSNAGISNYYTEKSLDTNEWTMGRVGNVTVI